MEPTLLFDIGLSIVTASFFAYIAKILRQPLILAYIVAGVLIGPVGLGLIKDEHSVRVLSDLGLAFLMFIIGLEIDLRKLMEAGITQVLLCGALGFGVAFWLGFKGLTVGYIAAAFAFSSTMIAQIKARHHRRKNNPWNSSPSGCNKHICPRLTVEYHQPFDPANRFLFC